jgi:hypothetical protein
MEAKNSQSASQIPVDTFESVMKHPFTGKKFPVSIPRRSFAGNMENLRRNPSPSMVAEPLIAHTRRRHIPQAVISRKRPPADGVDNLTRTANNQASSMKDPPRDRLTARANDRQAKQRIEIRRLSDDAQGVNHQGPLHR